MGRIIRSRGLLAGALALLLASGGSPAQEKPEVHPLVRRYELLFDALERELAEPGANPWDVPGLAARTGHDPKRLFEFVRDEIEFVPYRGIRAGSKGVLMSRRGNALEQALLLRELLEVSGMQSRLLSAELAEGDAAKLVDAFLAGDASKDLAGFDRPFQTDRPELLRDVCERAGLRYEVIERAISQKTEAGQLEFEECRQLTRLHTEALAAAWTASGERAACDAARVRADLVKAARRHYWIESRRSPAERWSVMDPVSVAKLPKGKHLAEVPENEEGRITVGLELTRITAKGKREQAVLLDVDVPLSEPLYHHVQLRVIPAASAVSVRDLSDMGPEGIYDWMAKFTRFQAYVAIGRARYSSKVFDRTGRLFDVSQTGQVKESGAGVRRGFGALAGGGGTKEEGGELIALTLRLGLSIPGETPIVQTRALLDPASRKRHRIPLTVADFWIQPHRMSGDFVSYRPKEVLAANRDYLIRAVSGIPEPTGSIRRLSGILFDLAVMRQVAMARQMEQWGAGVRLLWSRPTVILALHETVVDDEARRVSATSSVDIFENAGPFVPVDESAASRCWRMNLALGVFDSVAEAAVLSRTSWNTDPHLGFANLERARLAGLSLEVATGDARHTTALLAEEDRLWMRENLAGRIGVAAPAPGPATTWWCIDPDSGSCVARVPGGGGASKTEYVMMIKNTYNFVKCMVNLVLYDQKKQAAKRSGAAGPSSADDLQEGLKAAGCVVGFLGNIFGFMKVSFAKDSQEVIGKVIEVLGWIVGEASS